MAHLGLDGGIGTSCGTARSGTQLRGITLRVMTSYRIMTELQLWASIVKAELTWSSETISYKNSSY